MSAWETDGETRVWTPTGDRFYRVTRILNALAKPALVPWASKLVAERAVNGHDEIGKYIAEHGAEAAIKELKGTPNQQRDKAADMGSAVHAAVEAHNLGNPLPEFTDDVAPYMANFAAFLAEYEPEFLMAEATIANRTESYCGQLDAICRIAGKTYVLDVKTGKGVYPEVALQLAAYRHAEFIGLDDGTEHDLPKIDGGLVLHLRPRSWKLRQVRCDERIFDSFRYVREAFRWQMVTSKDVLGDVLPGKSKQREALEAFGITGEAA